MPTIAERPSQRPGLADLDVADECPVEERPDGGVDLLLKDTEGSEPVNGLVPVSTASPLATPARRSGRRGRVAVVTQGRRGGGTRMGLCVVFSHGETALGREPSSPRPFKDGRA